MILENIVKKTEERINAKKKILPEAELREKAYKIAERELKNTNGQFCFPFEKALKAEGIAFICEVKKASPSKGVIAEDFPYLKIACEYEEAGAAAISVLTEPFYFQGQDHFLEEIAEKVNIPVLRKDFTVDAYMLYEAKCMNASAVLLICAILSDSQIAEYLRISRELGLSALVEAHTEEEVKRALSCGASVIGVNNRDLKTFKTDIRVSEQLRQLVPHTLTYVSESGITLPEDIGRLQRIGTDAVLIGETLMRCRNKKKMMEELKGEA